jgi:acetate kinase
VAGPLVLAVNAGSTSLKLELVDAADRTRPVADLADVDAAAVAAVGHRIVHGGDRFTAPAIIDDDVLTAIREATRLAPLHNRPALAALDQVRAALPAVPHVAVFDTAFHASMPAAARTYALPERWRDGLGIRRYGFHGLSVEWSLERAGALTGRPPAALRVVVCHLGGGASVTACRDGRSVDTTMGFSPLEGVPMASRSGSVDPAALLYALRAGMDVDEVDHALHHESGLTGLAGTGDMRALLERAATDARARLAIDVYVHRVAGAVGAMAVAAGGLDALVFTGGVGERAAPVRAAVCAQLAHLGVELDDGANAGTEGDVDVAGAASPARVLVVHAREAVVIARAVRAAVAELT